MVNLSFIYPLMSSLSLSFSPIVSPSSLPSLSLVHLPPLSLPLSLRLSRHALQLEKRVNTKEHCPGLSRAGGLCVCECTCVCVCVCVHIEIRKAGVWLEKIVCMK